ncbi:MAG: PIN domain-containing protein [Chthoniobacterales bacterium]
MKYLFDSSALLAHALQEAGADEVQALIGDDSNDLFLSVLSFFELAASLKRQGAAVQIGIYWETYRQIATAISVNREITEEAWNLREQVAQRLPITDAIVAATARAQGATLVHRDRHLAAIPESLLPQLRL